MDRRLHTVQDRLVEHCTQTLKTVQGSVSAVTSVSSPPYYLIVQRGEKEVSIRPSIHFIRALA